MVKSYLRYVPSANFGIINAPACNIVFDKNSKTVITSSLQDILLWNLRQNTLTGRLSDSDNAAEVVYLSLNEKGSHLAAGYSDGSVRIWHLADRSCMVTFRGHNSPISYMVFDRESVRLASGSRDGEIVIWDLVSELGLCRLNGHKESIVGFHFFSCAPNMAVSGSKDTLLKVWDLSLKHCIESVVDHRFEVGSFDVTPDEQFLISGSLDANLRLFSIHAAHLCKSLQAEKDEKMITFYAAVERRGKEKIQSLQIDPSGQLLSLQSFDKALELYRISTPEELKRLASRRKRRQKEKSKPDGTDQLAESSLTALVKPGDEIKYLTSVRCSSKIRSSAFCSLPDPKSRTVQMLVAFFQNSIESYQVSLDPAIEPSLLYSLDQQGHRSEIRFVALDTQGSLILSGSREQIKVWNSVSGVCVRSINTFASGAVCGLLDPSSRFALVGHKDGCLAIYELGSGECVQSIPDAHAGTLWSMALKPDGSALMTGGADKEVRFWSLSASSPPHAALHLTHTRTLRMTDDVLCVRYSPDARFIALALLDCTVKVFYEETIAFFLSLYGHKLPVLSLDISSDSQLLISGSSDKNVKIWGLDFGDCHRSLFSHDQAVTWVAFVPNTHYYFTASKDRSIKFWDASKFTQIMKLKGHMGEVYALAVSQSGTALVSASADRSIRTWVRTDEQVFVEEEKEREMEELMDAQLLGEDPRNKLQDNDNDNMEGLHSGLAGTLNLESIKASEKLYEVIELAAEELAQLKEYDEKKALQFGLPLDRPTRHSLLLGYAKGSWEPSAQWIVLSMAERISAAELEQCLLVLPLHAVVSLLSMIGHWIQRGWNIYLSTRMLSMLLRFHGPQLRHHKALKLDLAASRKAGRSQLNEQRDLVGYNMTAMKMLSQEWDARHSTIFESDNALQTKSKDRAPDDLRGPKITRSFRPK